MARDRESQVRIFFPEETATTLRRFHEKGKGWLFADACNPNIGERVDFKLWVMKAVQRKAQKSSELECIVSRAWLKHSVWLTDVFSCARHLEGDKDKLLCTVVFRDHHQRYELVEGMMRVRLDPELLRLPLRHLRDVSPVGKD